MNLKRCMKTRVYLNLLEPDSVMKDNKEYNFAMMPPYECEELLSYANEELAEASLDETHIICNKFTECFTLGMVTRLSNQLHIDEEQLKIERTTDDYLDSWLAECLVCGGRGFFGKLCMKCKYGTYNLSIGVCLLCNKFGVLGLICNHCNQMKYVQKLEDLLHQPNCCIRLYI